MRNIWENLTQCTKHFAFNHQNKRLNSVAIKVVPTAVKYLHLWKNRQDPLQQRQGLIEILDQIRQKGWISLSTYDFLKTPTGL